MKFIYAFILILFAHDAVSQTSVGKKTNGTFALGQTHVIHSDILAQDRIVNIYLPEGYDSSLTYPVIYLLDGSADEDFIHVAGIVQFNTFAWVNRMPKSIVVGIANENRKYDFTSASTRASDVKLIPQNGGSSTFISFIEKELQPYINKTVRSNNDNTLIGQSLAGLLATEILLTKPQLFKHYIIISPSLWWRDGYLIQEKLNKSDMENGPVQVYIGVGKEGSIDGSTNHVMEVDAKLLASKIDQVGAKGVQVFFDYLPDENHATIGHQAVLNAFKMLYSKGSK